MSASTTAATTAPADITSLRDVTPAQWRAFWAVFLGWIVDSFDFNIAAFILIDIQQSFTVTDALAGALGTVTLLMRLIGGSLAGTAADKWGRKLPLTLAVLWFSLFAFLCGFSTSVRHAVWAARAVRARHGRRMGRGHAARVRALADATARLRLGTDARRLVLGIPAGRGSVPLHLSALQRHSGPGLAGDVLGRDRAGTLHAVDSGARRGEPDLARTTAPEERGGQRAGRPLAESPVSLARIFHKDLIGTTLQTTLVIGAFMCIYYSVNYWYPTLLREAGRDPLGYLVAFNFGAIAGTLTWGSLSQTRLGRRGAVTITVLVGMASLPLYLHATTTPMMVLGAALMGFFGMGVWGMAPAYTVERFPAEVRGAGPGFCYHAGAAIGALMPTLLGALRDRGFDLVNGMTIAMVISGICALIAIWSGPETRGRTFEAE